MNEARPHSFTPPQERMEELRRGPTTTVTMYESYDGDIYDLDRDNDRIACESLK